jgi:hypothetical protein
MIEERIRDSHAGGKKRDKDRERHHQKNQIDAGRDESDPESCVGQR